MTDTFLLRCFLYDPSVKRTISSSSLQVSSDQESHLAGPESCLAGDNWNVVSQQQSFQCGSSSAFHHVCPADVSSRHSCTSATLSHAANCSVDNSEQCNDTPIVLPFCADEIVSPTTAAAGSVRGCQSKLNCGQLNGTSAKYSSGSTPDNSDWTNTSFKLEHLDISGCWRITDFSIRCV